MKLRVFTLRLDTSTGAFDDSEVTTFLVDREALSVHHEYFVADLVHTLALLVTYRDPPRPGHEPRPRADPGPEVPDADQPLYQALKHWRNDRAKREGRPAYILFTNSQLAAVARAHPRSPAALGALPGIGEGKVREYGEEVLALVRTVAEATPRSGP